MNVTTTNKKKRDELYKNPIFVTNHVNAREELFKSFHELHEATGREDITIWLTAVRKIEKYFDFSIILSSKVFRHMAENFYIYNVEEHLEEYPLDESPQFHADCEEFICWFDIYLKREEI